jgi:hypothetical protein
MLSRKVSPKAYIVFSLFKYVLLNLVFTNENFDSIPLELSFTYEKNQMTRGQVKEKRKMDPRFLLRPGQSTEN